MAPVSRGFRPRRISAERALRIPPGGTRPRTSPCSAWPDAARRARGLVAGGDRARRARRLAWDELLALPSETFTVDIHCVTHWSKLGTTWAGVRSTPGRAAPSATHLIADCARRLHDEPAARRRARRQGVDRPHVRGRAAGAAHGGPARLLVPHLYFWKSAKWMGSTCCARTRRATGSQRLPRSRGPVAGAALPGRRVAPWRTATVRWVRGEARRCARSSLAVPGWPGHRAGQHADIRLTAEDGTTRAAPVLDRLGPEGPARRADRRPARRR